ncbi:MAG TPA: NIPSNAP family protein [Gaiellaceae bacterium]|nr:NIPSNAP family protein [Gaiellaceae bacterium]
MIVEQRDYQIHTGKLNELVGHYEAEGIVLQQRYLGTLVGAFTTEVGGLSTYTHMWAYESFEERMRRRAELQADEGWRAFLAKVQPLIQSQRNRILIPTSFSPLR